MRARLQYVIPAGFIALIASCVLAAVAPHGMITAMSADTAVSGTPLLLLIVPVIVVTALLRRRPLLEALLLGIDVSEIGEIDSPQVAPARIAPRRL
ncbi:MAG: hypothetical protein ACKOH8_09645, partial [Gemmatimonadota bacterium]